MEKPSNNNKKRELKVKLHAYVPMDDEKPSKAESLDELTDLLDDHDIPYQIYDIDVQSVDE